MNNLPNKIKYENKNYPAKRQSYKRQSYKKYTNADEISKK